MKLSELIAGAEAELRGDGSVEIADITYDSREVRRGALFVCVPGLRTDGHDYAASAAEHGAAALVVERFLDLPLPQVRVADTRVAMAELAERWFGDPTAELTLIGVTGTNGKTTTAFLVRSILEGAGTATGLLGTVKQVVGGEDEGVTRTTPEAIDLQRVLRRMVDAGDRACVMEVSSHALVLERTRGLRFDVAAFTNLTQDHLDFHTGMEDYFEAKRRLFGVPAGSPELAPPCAVVNVGDSYGARLAAELRGRPGHELISFSTGGDEADLRATDVDFDAHGSRFSCLSPQGQVDVEVPLPGHFNVANALGALAVAHAIGADIEAAAAALATSEPIPGRFEPVDGGQPFMVLVDYAHTPDSLASVLGSARLLTSGRVISVFGCGGDRDREKRPRMGAIGAELSDLAIVTSDNPRSEEPEAIIDEVVAGIGADAVEIEPDRRSAIARALEAAGDGDTVVIAGKGHEEGQEFAGGRKVPFDDRSVVRSELARLASR